MANGFSCTECKWTDSWVGLLFIIGCTFLCNATDAQILRVNRGVAALDSAGVTKGFVSMDMSLNNRNSTAAKQVTFIALNASGDIGVNTEKHIYYLISNIRYFRSTGGPILSTGYAHARANFMRKKKLSYEVFSQVQYDQGRNLKERILGGGGCRYQIMDALAAAIGVMQEKEVWQELTDASQFREPDLTKFTSYITGQLRFSEQVTLLLTGYFQTGWDKSIEALRNRVSGDLALNVRMGKRLELSVKSTFSYEDRPIIPISRSVYALSNGLNYRF